MLKTALVAGSVLALVTLAGCGGQSRPRSDWRRPRPCETDADCGGGRCVVGANETQPSCSGGALPPLPPQVQGGERSTDGGARPPAPGPSIQPAPGDIQI